MRRSSGVRPDLVALTLQNRLTIPSVSSSTLPQAEGSLIWDNRLKALYISNGHEWEYIPPGSLSIQDLYSVLSVGNFTGGLNIDLNDGGKIISSNSDIELDSTLSSGSGDILLYPKGEVVTTGDVNLTQASALISTDGDIVIDGTVSTGSGKIFLNPKGGENGIVIINGSLDVIGTTTSIETQTLLVKNNRVYLNAGNISTTPLAGYVVVNYLATSNFSTVTGSFTNGGVTGPTVQTSGSYIFSAGDIIQISSAHNPDNNGLFEVNTDVGGLITIRGVGGVTPTFSMFQNNFVADSVAGGRVTLVNVGVASASTSGLWQVNTPGSSTVGMVFRNLATQLQNSGTGTYSLIYNVSTSTLKMISSGSGVSIVDSGTGNLTISSSGLNTLSNEGGGARVYDDVSSTPTDALLRTLLGTSNGLTVSQGLTTITIDNTLTGGNVGVGTGTLFSAKSGATLQFNTLAGTSNGLTVSAPSSNVITIDNTLTGGNVGVGTGTVFSAKSGATLQFNTLAGTSNGLTVSAPSSNVITIDNTLTGSNLGSGTGLFVDKSTNLLRFNSLEAGTGISLSTASNTITITNSLTSPYQIVGSLISPISSGTSAISSGTSNTISSSGTKNFISGGTSNSIATGGENSIFGGKLNTITSSGGGTLNKVFVIGGENNNIDGAVASTACLYSSIVGGNSITIASGTENYTLGGKLNTITSTGGGAANKSLIIGGESNNIDVSSSSSLIQYSMIIGGANNSLTNSASTTAQRNMMIGGSQNTISSSGNGNVIITGFQNSITSGSENVIIGGSNTSTVTSGNNSVLLGGGCSCSHSNNFMFSDGSTLSSSATNRFMIGTSNGGFIYTNAGRTTGVSLSAGSTAWAIVSDINQKKNIISLNNSEIMKKVNRLGVYSYSMKGNPDEQICYGTTSQEWHSIFETKTMNVEVIDDTTGKPRVDENGEVMYREEPAKDLLRIDQGDQIGVILSCLKYLYSENKNIKRKNRKYRKLLEVLEKRISRMENLSH